MIARRLLAAIPDDLVALQVLGLTLHRRGRHDSALRFLRRAEASPGPASPPSTAALEPARTVSWREATRPGSALAEAWRQIADLQARHGHFGRAADAQRAALRARGGVSAGD